MPWKGFPKWVVYCSEKTWSKTNANQDFLTEFELSFSGLFPTIFLNWESLMMRVVHEFYFEYCQPLNEIYEITVVSSNIFPSIALYFIWKKGRGVLAPYVPHIFKSEQNSLLWTLHLKVIHKNRKARYTRLNNAKYTPFALVTLLFCLAWVKFI